MTEVEEVEDVEADETRGTAPGPEVAAAAGASDPVEDEAPATPDGRADGEETPGAVDGEGEVAAVEAAVDASGDADVAPLPPEFRVMDVEDVSLELPAQYPQITLVENEPPLRTLTFPVGLVEGTALALALRRMTSPRPMTHELFMEVMQRARIDVIALRLVGRENGNYLAELDVMAPQGRERIPCRPSDGLVLALRMPVSAPILVDVRLLEESGDVVPSVEE
jgi:bifunctional DNase/RNase